jgi:hypothetical protein
MNESKMKTIESEIRSCQCELMSLFRTPTTQLMKQGDGSLVPGVLLRPVIQYQSIIIGVSSILKDSGVFEFIRQKHMIQQTPALQVTGPTESALIQRLLDNMSRQIVTNKEESLRFMAAIMSTIAGFIGAIEHVDLTPRREPIIKYLRKAIRWHTGSTPDQNVTAFLERVADRTLSICSIYVQDEHPEIRSAIVEIHAYRDIQNIPVHCRVALGLKDLISTKQFIAAQLHPSQQHIQELCNSLLRVFNVIDAFIAFRQDLDNPDAFLDNAITTVQSICSYLHPLCQDMITMQIVGEIPLALSEAKKYFHPDDSFERKFTKIVTEIHITMLRHTPPATAEAPESILQSIIRFMSPFTTVTVDKVQHDLEDVFLIHDNGFDVKEENMRSMSFIGMNQMGQTITVIVVSENKNVRSVGVDGERTVLIQNIKDWSKVFDTISVKLSMDDADMLDNESEMDMK